jgi:hypothetical protein
MGARFVSPHPHSDFFAAIIFACCLLHVMLASNVPRELVYRNKRADDRGFDQQRHATATPLQAIRQK